jgi:chromosome segregation ATPase
MAPNNEALILEALGDLRGDVQDLSRRLDVHLATCSGRHENLNDRLNRSSQRAAKLDSKIDAVESQTRDVQRSMTEAELEQAKAEQAQAKADLASRRASIRPASGDSSKVAIARWQAIATIVGALAAGGGVTLLARAFFGG